MYNYIYVHNYINFVYSSPDNNCGFTGIVSYTNADDHFRTRRHMSALW